MIKKTVILIKELGSEIIENLKTLQGKIISCIKKPETKHQVIKIVGILFAGVMAILVTLWTVTMIFSIIQNIIEKYSIFLLGIFCILCWFFGWIQTKKDAVLEREKKQNCAKGRNQIINSSEIFFTLF